MSEGKSQRAVVVAREADQSGSMFSQFYFPHCAFAFRRAQLHFRNQATEILISNAGRNEQRKTKFTTETQRHRGIFVFGLLMVYLISGNCVLLCVSVSVW